jgi:hypothetical protein
MRIVVGILGVTPLTHSEEMPQTDADTHLTRTAASTPQEIRCGIVVMQATLSIGYLWELPNRIMDWPQAHWIFRVLCIIAGAVVANDSPVTLESVHCNSFS